MREQREVWYGEAPSQSERWRYDVCMYVCMYVCNNRHACVVRACVDGECVRCEMRWRFRGRMMMELYAAGA